MASQPPDDLAELTAASNARRERLTAEVRTLAFRGLFAPRKVEGLKGGQGYRNTHAGPPLLMNPRYATTYMRGPMKRVEIRKARGIKDPVRGETRARKWRPRLPPSRRASAPPAACALRAQAAGGPCRLARERDLATVLEDAQPASQGGTGGGIGAERTGGPRHRRELTRPSRL